MLADGDAERLWTALSRKYIHISSVKEPLINRGAHREAYIICAGTLLRTIAIDNELVRLAAKQTGCQIISVGCGFDTRRQRLLSRLAACKYYEVDFPRVIRLHHHAQAVPADLRDASFLQALPDISFQCPTIILSECVLMYLSPEAGDQLIGTAKALFAQLTFVSFEPLKSDDAFGEQMVSNLQGRLPSKLLSLGRYATLDAQTLRFGMPHAAAFTLNQLEAIYAAELHHPSLQLDEREEWSLISEHYALVVASTSSLEQ